MSAHLLASSAANGVKVWEYTAPTSRNTAGGESLCRLVHTFGQEEAAGGVNAVCWSEDGKQFSLAGSDGVVSVRNADGSLADTIGQGDLRGASTFGWQHGRYERRGRQVLLAGSHGVVRRWDRQDGKWLEPLQSMGRPITAIALDVDQTHLASVSVAGQLMAHSLQRGALNAVDYSKFRKSLLLCGGDDGAVHMFDTNRSQTPLQTFQSAHGAPVKGTVFSPFNRFLMCSAGLDKHIILYDAEKKGAIKTLVADQPLTTLAFKSDGVTIAGGTLQGKLVLFDLRSSSRPLMSVWAHEPHPVKCAAFQSRVSERKSTTLASKRSSTPVVALPSVGAVETSAVRSGATGPRIPSPTSTQRTTSADRHTAADDHTTTQRSSSNATYMDMFSPVKDTGDTDGVDVAITNETYLARNASSPTPMRPASSAATTTYGQTRERLQSDRYENDPISAETGDTAGVGSSALFVPRPRSTSISVSPHSSMHAQRPRSALASGDQAGSSSKRHSRTRSMATASTVQGLYSGAMPPSAASTRASVDGLDGSDGRSQISPPVTMRTGSSGQCTVGSAKIGDI
ncbi:WD40-repeat-containing domain protein [Thamnocephalis sphaerospora]|uniref:WD40-repeat-containing domain protein n=1 Tax=Thamnocephalis sphaerospora TaxID=78915 RepID=A0A4P9XJD9_9FUNG|nr:WD40-repeat-containing domain protein [Thamnocephalis sphaerospora]|eukprot:RKP05300.1 WD40-repeat-containing domain protein [Thamnocephalis sphaerospora]